ARRPASGCCGARPRPAAGRATSRVWRTTGATPTPACGTSTCRATPSASNARPRPGRLGPAAQRVQGNAGGRQGPGDAGRADLAADLRHVPPDPAVSTGVGLGASERPREAGAAAAGGVVADASRPRRVLLLTDGLTGRQEDVIA